MSTESTSPETKRERLLDAILEHVREEGWTRSAFESAASDAGVSAEEAWHLCPRGPLDLAKAYHRRGDGMMRNALEEEKSLSEMRIRDRVILAVRLRIETASDREIVRRSSALFALPMNAADGATLIWNTADAIWTALGDSSDDVNWYTKRAILSGVYSATILYWLGDESPEFEDTWAFLDRRISNVMEFEKFKGQLRKNPLTRPFWVSAEALLSGIRPPPGSQRDDLPGR